MASSLLIHAKSPFCEKPHFPPLFHLASFSFMASKTFCGLQLLCKHSPWQKNERNPSPTRALSLQNPWALARARLPLKLARRKNLKRIILNIAAYRDDDALSGNQSLEEKKSKQEPRWDVDKLLAVGEGICILSSTSACIATVVHNKHNESLAEASTNPKFCRLQIWQLLPLLAALVFNIALRTRQWQRTPGFNTNREIVGASGFTIDQRISKLEEDMGSSVTIIRVLSRQFEKLGVRFRLTRQTLRDAIKETASLSQKTSDVVAAVASREELLEMELEALQKALLGMQENQLKQLELIAALGKSVRGMRIAQTGSIATERKFNHQGPSQLATQQNLHGTEVSSSAAHVFMENMPFENSNIGKSNSQGPQKMKTVDSKKSFGPSSSWLEDAHEKEKGLASVDDLATNSTDTWRSTSPASRIMPDPWK